MNMSPTIRNVIVAIDDSEYAEFAFDCKSILMFTVFVYFSIHFLKKYNKFIQKVSALKLYIISYVQRKNCNL